ncbi:MAG: sigma-70 family RNA polymerase sigma factor [Planctomycetaceae bacterium]|nr:sigma-70 family RNA polymerase sigma factor [Planctomycetaceae bacterium]
MPDTFNHRWHRKALMGEQAAVEALAQAAIGPLFRFCFYRLGGNRHLTEEVVQETLVRAIRELEKYEPVRAKGNILGWLTRLARNEIRRALGQEGAAVNLQALWDKLDDDLRCVYSRIESEPLSRAVLDREETREMVNATMAQLPAKYREALEAKYVAGKSVRDIAAALRISEKAVESQLTRARKAFRATFTALNEA